MSTKVSIKVGTKVSIKVSTKVSTKKPIKMHKIAVNVRVKYHFKRKNGIQSLKRGIQSLRLIIGLL